MIRARSTAHSKENRAMPLDPQAQTVLDLMPAMPDFSTLDLALIRAGMAQGPLQAGEPEAVAKVDNRTVPGPAGPIPVRAYTPQAAGRAPLPGLVFFHGGGFVLCDLDTHDGLCRSLANAAGCVVVSVDYRLAPEHRYPAAPEDCYAATRWVAKNGGELGIDVTRIAIGGDSAGGNLTAVTALMARDRGGPALRFQLLIYPVTDCAFETASYRENSEGYFLTTGMMRWFWENYLAKPEQGREAYASPLRAANLANLPPGLCITAGYDPLRDEGEAYAKRLLEAGVDIRASRYSGMFHGFVSMTAQLDKAREAVAEAGAALRAALV
jgi:acetyl esterase